MPTLLSRVARMTPAEIRCRLRATARVQAQRLRVAARRPSWDRRALLKALSAAAVTPELADASERRDWAAANALLRSALAGRPSRFALDPQSSMSLRRAIVSRWPGSVADASGRANAILDGRFDLLGYEALSFAHDGQAIDWHVDPVHGCTAPMRFWADVPYLDPRTGDHKIIWELNRQQHLLALTRAWWLTADTRYRDAIAAHIGSWMMANPPLIGVNWASMLELAFRSMSWLWGLHALLREDASSSGCDESGWLVDLIVGVDRQLTHVAQNLSLYFSPNTHLTGEALALYVAGAALPELAASANWLDTGRAVLLSELSRQVAADGGHAERSTHYHRYTLDFYLLALITAERIGDADAVAVFRNAVSRLAACMQALCDDRGCMPQIGDDDGGMLWPIAGRDPRDVRDSLGLAAVILDRPDLAPWGVPEEAFWVGWSTRPEVFADSPLAVCDRKTMTREVRTDAFGDTGFVTIRDECGDHLVFDAGPHGYLNGGHAHADALSITLAIDAAPLLIDPGTATYTTDPPLRDRMRSTALHNTLTLDSRSSSATDGPFRWRTRTDARLEVLRHNAGFAWAEAQHAGFAPVRHRRSVVHSLAGGWLIVDDVRAIDPHTAQLHWHFAPAWRVSCERDGQIGATDDEGRHAWLLHDGGDMWLAYGDDDTGLGWCSPRYGELLPTCAVRIMRAGIGPLSMITWIGAGIREDAPSLQRMDVDADREGAAIAVSVRDRRTTIVTLLRPGDAVERDTRGCTCGEYHTDGRLLQYTMDGEAPASMSLADASHALALRDGWLSVGADSPVSDLHLAIRGDRLEVWSTAPPGRLHVNGALSAVRALRLNGRELRVASPVHDHGLTIGSSEWREADTACVA
jgi:hypothetical protein